MDLPMRPEENGNPGVRPVDAAGAIAAVYEDLRAIAAKYLQKEAPGATLQPTLIVHEAYARIAGSARAHYRDPAHFRAIACQEMRRVLVDHARSKQATKRGAGAARISLPDDLASTQNRSDVCILDVDRALERLARCDERAARVVELRFFGGLTVDEAALALGISSRLVDDDWKHSKAWLARELGGDKPDPQAR